MTVTKSIFTISLDFELNWGVRDHRNLDEYGTNILGARKAIIDLLALFEKYNIHATWATVGLLFNESKTELLNSLPEQKPSYLNEKYSPYHSIQTIGDDELKDPYHYGWSLIKKIQSTPFQEIGTHTYSHYYCLEEGQTIDEFEVDILTALNIASKKNIAIKSIIFPRNQFNEEYLEVLKKYSIIAYRGNEYSWLYNARDRQNESNIRRLFRLVDTYFNISGHHIYDLNQINHNQVLINTPSSRFLRPYSPKLQLFETLKLKRIKKSMLAAAKQNKAFHLWWHPHNFGTYTLENLSFLESILKYYSVLNKQYNMTSLNIKEIAETINGQK